MITENEIIYKVLEHWRLILFCLLIAGPGLLLHWRQFNGQHHI